MNTRSLVRVFSAAALTTFVHLSLTDDASADEESLFARGSKVNILLPAVEHTPRHDPDPLERAASEDQ